MNKKLKSILMMLPLTITLPMVLYFIGGLEFMLAVVVGIIIVPLFCYGFVEFFA
jgi:hypothetical protein